MTIRTVLNILSVNQFEEDLKTAVDFCGAHGAHLNAMVISLGAPPMIGEYNAISTVWIEERQREIDALSEKTDEIKTILGRSGISYEVQDVYTEFAWADEDIAERALYADVVLVGRQAARDDQLRKRIIDGALFRTPTPILINRGTRPICSNRQTLFMSLWWIRSPGCARMARSRAPISPPILPVMASGFRWTALPVADSAQTRFFGSTLSIHPPT